MARNDTPSKELSVQLGAGAQTEEIGLVTTESGVLTWSLCYRQDFFSDDLELYHNDTITYSVSDRINTSYKTTTGLRYEITDLLYANLSVDFDYETDPVDFAENEDVALSVGLGLEFRVCSTKSSQRFSALTANLAIFILMAAG